MKRRLFCLILVFSLLLSGCSPFGTRIKEPVTFYYLCGNYQTDLCCVITSEEREAAGHSGDLAYLLALYLMGPTNDEFVAPVPAGTRVTSQNNDGHILLELSDTLDSLTDIEFTLACACLTLTCLEITDAEDVTIRSADREKIMNHSVLTLYDSTFETLPTEEP